MKYKLTAKQVKAYEKMSAFKTTGAVTMVVVPKKVLDVLDSLYQPKG